MKSHAHFYMTIWLKKVNLNPQVSWKTKLGFWARPNLWKSLALNHLTVATEAENLKLRVKRNRDRLKGKETNQSHQKDQAKVGIYLPLEQNQASIWSCWRRNTTRLKLFINNKKTTWRKVCGWVRTLIPAELGEKKDFLLQSKLIRTVTLLKELQLQNFSKKISLQFQNQSQRRVKSPKKFNSQPLMFRKRSISQEWFQ